MPLPQLAPLVWQVPAVHLPPVPHAMPSCDESTTAGHVCCAVHCSLLHCGAAAQSVAAFTHCHVQSALQPTPPSQSTPRSTKPMPPTCCVHTTLLQKPVVPQNVLSGSQVPAEHSCVVSLHVTSPAQLSVGVQSRLESVDTQLNVQSLLQPSPSVEFASSHSSLPVT